METTSAMTEGQQAYDRDADTAPAPVSDFLMFSGSTFYTRESFIEECAAQGISRRMSSYHLPADLVCGRSRVFVAFGGTRTADDGEHESEIFGYFVPSAVEFIAGEDGERYSDIIAGLERVTDVVVVDGAALRAEQDRRCGRRHVGGTYLVTRPGVSPLSLLEYTAAYQGNHFRGLMRLTPAESTQIDDGAGVSKFVDESCMACGRAFKASMRGHERAETERRRIDREGAPKWRLLCKECQLREAARKREERAAQDVVA